MKTLLVDANNIIIRYTATAPENSNILYGILNLIKKFIYRHQLEQIIFVFDSQVPQFRKELYPQYKENRSPNDLMKRANVQMDIMYNLLPQMGIVVATLPGYEADDCIYKLTQIIEGEIILCSADKDFQQVICDRIEVIEPNLNKIDKPNHFLIEKALIGDKSDNIKGVSQIGKKRARIIVNEIKESKLQKFLDNIDKSELYYQKLFENKEIIVRNYNMMSLDYAYFQYTKHICGEYVHPEKFTIDSFKKICKEYGAQKHLLDLYIFQKTLENLKLSIPEGYEEIQDRGIKDKGLSKPKMDTDNPTTIY